MLGIFKGRNVWEFMDDLCIGSNILQEHLKDIEKNFEVMMEAGMKFKYS